MLLNVHSKLELESTLIWYTGHMCGIIDMSNIAIRRNQIDYRPTKHDSVTDDLCPVFFKEEEEIINRVPISTRNSNQFT